MSEPSGADPVRDATKLLAAATTPDGNQYLVMHAGDLVDLLRASGLTDTQIDEIVRVAVAEHGAPKLAHLDEMWRRAD